MKKIHYLILIGLFIPYYLVGIDFGNSILLLLGGLLLCTEKQWRFEKKELLLGLGLAAVGVISIFSAGNKMNGLEGLSVYLALPIYLVLFRTYFRTAKDQEDGTRVFSYGVLWTAGISIGISFFFQASRLSGFMNYSNTYGLILLVALIFYRSFSDRQSLILSGEVLLLWATLLTGSRTTILLLLLYMGWECFRDLKKLKQPAFILLYGGLALGLYLLYESSKPWALFALILMVTGDYLIKLEPFLRKRAKGAKLGVFIISGISLGCFLLIRSSLLTRFREISIETGVLQERFVLFQDAFAGILKAPLGHGPNSFPYMQYFYQSAFYDVRYIHNSVLQLGFDLGLLGMVLFLLLLGLWGVGAIKGKTSGVWVFGVILFHSLLDFDLSYFLLFMPLLLVSSPIESKTVEKTESKNVEKRNQIFVKNIGMFFVVLFSEYVLLTSALFMMGAGAIEKGSFEQGIKYMDMAEGLAPFDGEINLLKAQAYFQLESGEAVVLCEKNLKAAVEKNPKDVRSYVNLGFLYKRQMDYERMVASFKKTIAIQHFDPELYERVTQSISGFTNEQNGGNVTTEQITMDLKWFWDQYAASQKQLNPKAKYMKNQLGNVE